MPPEPAVHPSNETLIAFGIGKIDEAGADAVLRHLETCPDCKRRVAEMSADSFVGRLREAAGGRDGTPEPQKSLSGLSRSVRPAPGVALPPELANSQQYESVRELGRGGMGVVYLATNKLMDRPEVLKVLNKAFLDRPGAAERFLREIRSAARLQHPNVVAAYSALQLGELLVFAMEYVDGEDLAQLVETRGPLPVANACYYAYQAALGLQHAHERGMVHRDIKPSNLILTKSGGKSVVKILDFGLAKATSEKGTDSGLTGEGKMMGTPNYMAPEQARNATKADIRADIYSLGASLYHLLAGRVPFTGESVYEVLRHHEATEATPLNLVRPEVPAELAAVVAKMMAKEAGKRYQTPGEVAKALTPFVKPGTKSSPDVSPGAARVAAPITTTPILAVPATPAPMAENVWESLSPATSRIPTNTVKASPASQTKSRAMRLWPLIAVGVVCAGLLAAWAGGLVVKTKDGTIELTELPPDADVFVDGEKVRVTWDAGRKTAEVRVKPGTRKLEVKQGDVAVVGETVEIDSGGRKAMSARLKDGGKLSVSNGGESNRVPLAGAKDLSRNPNREEQKTATLPTVNRDATVRRKDVWAVEGGMLVTKMKADWDDRILFGDPNWSNYTFSFEAKKIDEEKFGVGAIFRASSLDNRYEFNYGGYANGEFAELSWHISNVFHRGKNDTERNLLCKRIKPMEMDKWYRFAVTLKDDEITCRNDDVKYFTYSDDTITRGQVGFRTSPGRFQFRNIKVTDPDGKVLWEGLPTLPSEAKNNAPMLPEEKQKTLIPPNADRASVAVGKGKASWSVTGDELVKTSLDNSAIHFGMANWTDYSFSADVKVTQTNGEGIGLIYRNSESNNYWHEINLRATGAYRWLDKQFGVLAGTTEQRDMMSLDRWYRMSITTEGEVLRGYVDGRLVYSIKDSSIKSGRVGFRAFGVEGRIRNIQVKDLAGKLLWDGLPELPK